MNQTMIELLAPRATGAAPLSGSRGAVLGRLCLACSAALVLSASAGPVDDTGKKVTSQGTLPASEQRPADKSGVKQQRPRTQDKGAVQVGTPGAERPKRVTSSGAVSPENQPPAHKSAAKRQRQSGLDKSATGEVEPATPGDKRVTGQGAVPPEEQRPADKTTVKSRRAPAIDKDAIPAPAPQKSPPGS